MAFCSLGIIGLMACSPPPRDVGDLNAPRNQHQAALHSQYSALASEEYDFGQWRASELFRDKAVAAQQGHEVAMVDPTRYRLDATEKRRAINARALIMSHLTPEEKRLFPEQTAEAQTAFDCWVIRMDATYKHPSTLPTCEQRWNQAVAYLEGAAAEHGYYREGLRSDYAEVYQHNLITAYEINFLSNSSRLSRHDAAILDRVADDVRSSDPMEVVVIGYSTFAESPDYSLELAKIRTDKVADALVRRGVPANIIVEHSYGDIRPAGPFGDNVTIGENSRVVIELRR
jgi:outer membrane protein OmpA-like peptidoglycan-associated protein